MLCFPLACSFPVDPSEPRVGCFRLPFREDDSAFAKEAIHPGLVISLSINTMLLLIKIYIFSINFINKILLRF